MKKLRAVRDGMSNCANCDRLTQERDAARAERDGWIAQAEREHATLAALLADEEKARAEVERLNREHDIYVLQEGERMTTALARVRAALEEMAKLFLSIDHYQTRLKHARASQAEIRLEQLARAALEGR